MNTQSENNPITNFRIWDKETQCMYMLDLLDGNTYNVGTGYICATIFGEERQHSLFGNGNIKVLDPDNCIFMMCTGQSDKNNKLLYANDFVKVPGKNDPQEITYNHLSLSWHIGYDITYSQPLTELLYVGNRYENTELFK